MAEHFSFDEFLALNIDDRAPLYQGIMLAVLYDVSLVTDDQLRILSYGFYKDQELPNQMGESNFQSARDDVYASVKEQGDYQAAWEIAQGDKGALKEMGTEVQTGAPIVMPLNLGALATGFSGAKAIASAGPVASALTRTLAVASTVTRATGRALASNVGKNVMAVFGGMGVAGLTAGIMDYSLNPEKYEEILGEAADEADAITERIAVTTTFASMNDEIARRSADLDGYQIPPQSVDTFDRPAGEGQAGAPPQAAGGSEALEGYQPGQAPPGGGSIEPPPDPLVGEDTLGPGEDYGYIKRDRPVQAGGDPRFGSPEGEAIYNVSDYRVLVGSMTEWQIDLLQQRMLRAGYMNEKQMTGLMDSKTMSTLNTVLFEANANTATWQEWSNKMAIAGDEARKDEDEKAKQARLDAIGPYQRSVYLEPDYAALSLTAKDAVEQQLGRKINDWEMDILNQTQQDAYRDQYQANESANLSKWSESVRAIEEDLGVDDTVGGGTVQMVNPQARFQEVFDKQFGKEIQRREQTAGAQSRTDTLMQGLNNAMGAISR